MLLPVVLFTCIGLLLIGLAVPLLRRRVGPNPWYGLRVPATLADQAVWYEANARSARDLVLLGVVQVILALGLPLLVDLPPGEYARINGGVISAGAVVAAVAGWRRANRMLADRRRDANG